MLVIYSCYSGIALGALVSSISANFSPSLALTQPRIKAICQAAAAPAGEYACALLVGEIIDPQRSSLRVGEQFDHWFETEIATDLEIGQVSATVLLDRLVATQLGIPSATAFSVEHSHVGFVLERRQGIPISLAVIAMETARRLEFNAVGVNYPGHFLIQIDDLFVDPVTMQQIKSADVERGSLVDTPRTSPLSFTLRMLNNLKANCLRARGWVDAIALVELQIALCESAPSPHHKDGAHIVRAGTLDTTHSEYIAAFSIELGEIWLQLGAVSAARQSFERCRQMSVQPELIARTEKHLLQLQGRSEKLH